MINPCCRARNGGACGCACRAACGCACRGACRAACGGGTVPLHCERPLWLEKSLLRRPKNLAKG